MWKGVRAKLSTWKVWGFGLACFCTQFIGIAAPARTASVGTARTRLVVVTLNFRIIPKRWGNRTIRHWWHSCFDWGKDSPASGRTCGHWTLYVRPLSFCVQFDGTVFVPLGPQIQAAPDLGSYNVMLLVSISLNSILPSMARSNQRQNQLSLKNFWRSMLRRSNKPNLKNSEAVLISLPWLFVTRDDIRLITMSLADGCLQSRLIRMDSSKSSRLDGYVEAFKMLKRMTYRLIALLLSGMDFAWHLSMPLRCTGTYSTWTWKLPSFTANLDRRVIHVQLPTDIGLPPYLVGLCTRSVYGLADAPPRWWKNLDKFLSSPGLQELTDAHVCALKVLLRNQNKLALLTLRRQSQHCWGDS